MLVSNKKISFKEVSNKWLKLKKSNKNSSYEKYENIVLTHLDKNIGNKLCNEWQDIKSLSEILGHSSISITLDIYVHSSLEFNKAQIQKIEVPNFVAELVVLW